MYILIVFILLQGAQSTDTGTHNGPATDIEAGINILKEVDALIIEYLSASNPKTDQKRHDLIVSQFHSFLEQLTARNLSHILHSGALLSKVVMATFDSRISLLGENFQSRIVSVKWSEFQSLTPSWSADLLIELLRSRNSSSSAINDVGVVYDKMGVVNTTCSPMELAVRLGMIDILDLLGGGGSGGGGGGEEISVSSHTPPSLCSSSLLHYAIINHDIATVHYIIQAITSKLETSGSGGSGNARQDQELEYLCELLISNEQHFGRSPLDIASFQCTAGYSCQVFDHLSMLARKICKEEYDPQRFLYFREGERTCPVDQDVDDSQGITGRERLLNCIHNGRSCGFEAFSGHWDLYGDHQVGGKEEEKGGTKGGCHLPRIPVDRITPQEFERDFVNLSIPVLITGLTRNWPLRQLLRRDALLEKWADVDVLVGKIPYGEKFGDLFGYATLLEFVQYMDGYGLHSSLDIDAENFQAPLYIFDDKILENHFKAQYTFDGLIPQTWKSIPGHHQFALGPVGSGAPFHFHCHAMNALMYGRKKWFLYPPSAARFSNQHPLLWYLTEYPNSHSKPLECTQMPGEVVYVPSRWSHATINMDECIGIAVEYDTGDC